MLNKQLQGENKTLVDGKTKIFSLATFIEVCKENIFRFFCLFHWLIKCEVIDATVLVTVDYVKIVISNFREQFSDLEQIDFPTCPMQPILEDISDVLMQCQ